ncbi:MAG: Gx transporter family protein [Alkaliphilus sp.]|nr:Gx transporter family protein [Alkaliphilus sp.]
MRTKKLAHLSLLTAVGIAIHIIESFIPLPIQGVPGAKLGLANIVNLITLVVFGFKEAIVVAVLRCFVGALGTGAVTGFFFSLLGALASTVVMFIAYKFGSKKFSLIGVSIFGALSHNIAQLSVAGIIINNILVFSYLPIMTLTSLFTGYFVGLTANYGSKNLQNILSKTENKY